MDDLGEHCLLSIKLCSGDFIYTDRPFIKSSATTHSLDEWFVLGDDILEEMQFLDSLANETTSKIEFYYNVKHKRIKILLFGPKTVETPNMLISFEEANPCYAPDPSLMIEDSVSGIPINFNV